MLLMNPARFIVSGGATQRNPYFDFANAAAYETNGEATITITGGQLLFTSTPAFKGIQQNYGFRTPVTPSIPYTVAIDCVSMTGGPKDVQLIAEYWKGQTFGDGLSSILSSNQSGNLATSTGQTKSFVCTPPSDCTHVQLYFESREALTGVFDNLKMTG